LKPKIYFKNGYMNVDKCEHSESLDWLTPERDHFYFHLNEYTRQLFIRDILPVRELYYISRETLLMLRDIDLSHKRDNEWEIVHPHNVVLKSYQIEAVKKMLSHDRHCIFLGPGTGKTFIAISYILSKKPDKVIIYMPQSVIGQYTKQCLKKLPQDYVITNDVEVFKIYDKAILISNYEQLHNHMTLVGGARIDAMILDESHMAKNYMSNINQQLRKLAVNCDDIYLFTGTPQDKIKSEIFFQLAILDTRFVPTKSKFLNRYFQLDDYFQPIKELRPKELEYMLNRIAYGAETEYLLSLPPKNEIVIECARPEPYYSTLEKDRILELENGSTIICDTPSALVTKLRQICNGGIITENGTFRFDTDKEVQLYKLLFGLNTAVIYTQFDSDIEIVSKVCEDHGRSYAVVSGKIKRKEKDANIEAFKKGEVDFLVMQARSGNAGLDLMNTNNIVFYSLPTSYIVFEQCLYRIRRIGQKKTCNYYFLVCKGSVEKKILKSLQKKKNFTARIYKNLRKGGE